MATPSYEDRNALIANTTFRGRVRYAMIQETNGVLPEDPATPNHDNRIALAKAVLAAPDSCVDRAMPVLLTNTDISNSAPDGASLPDETLSAVIAAAWNAIANLMFPPAQ